MAKKPGFNAIALICAGFLCVSCAQGPSTIGPIKGAKGPSSTPTNGARRCDEVSAAITPTDNAAPVFPSGVTTICWDADAAVKK